METPARRMTTATYLDDMETSRRRELVWGVVREPPAPFYGHQTLVTDITVLLDRHVRRLKLGRVCVSPVDVILDRKRALIVQPDVIFISSARRGIATDRVWGAPDLVVEVLSPGTVRHDRSVKVGWYRRYGVRECWLVDPRRGEVTVIDVSLADAPPRTFRASDRVHSAVLPRLRLRVADVFR